MSIANLQTLGILKKSRISKDATPAPGGDASGGAVTVNDLKSGGLLRPEQGWRSGISESRERRKLRKPVVLGKSCSEIGKDADFEAKHSRGEGGRFDEYHAANNAAREASTAAWDASDKVKRPGIKNVEAAEMHSRAEAAHKRASNAGDVTPTERGWHLKQAKTHQDEDKRLMDAWHGVPQKTTSVLNKSGLAKAKDALGHGSEKRNGLSGQTLNPGESVRFHTPAEGDSPHSMQVVEDRGDRVLVQHNKGFEDATIKPQSVHLKSELTRDDSSDKRTFTMTDVCNRLNQSLAEKDIATARVGGVGTVRADGGEKRGGGDDWETRRGVKGEHPESQKYQDALRDETSSLRRGITGEDNNPNDDAIRAKIGALQSKMVAPFKDDATSAAHGW